MNGKLYIGSSKNIQQRWNSHKNRLNKGVHHSYRLQGSWNKHGSENFEFSVIEEIANIEYLLEREQYWLDLLQPFKKGYNISPRVGSRLGVKASQEVRAKIKKKALERVWTEEHKNISRENLKKAIPTPESRRKAAEKIRGRPRSKEVKEKIGNAHRGKEVSKETREKLSKIFKGRVISDETKKKINEAKKKKRMLIEEEMKNGVYTYKHAKLTGEDVINIKYMIRDKVPIKQIAKMYNMDVSHMYKIKNGKAWEHIKIIEEENAI